MSNNEKNDILIAKMRSKKDIYEQGQILIDYAVELTKSEYGQTGIMSEGSYHTLGINGMGWEACKMPIKEVVFPPSALVGKHLWLVPIRTNKSYISNSPSTDPESGGIPEGHPPINSFLGIPLRHHGNPIGTISVANKAGGYTNEDVKNLESLGQTVGHFIDISTLMLNVEKYQTLVKNTQDALILHNTNGQILYSNKALSDRLGFKYQDVVETSLIDLVSPNESNRLLEIFKKVFKTKTPELGYEVEFIGEDGQKRYFSMSTSTTGGANITALASVASDITLRKSLEKRAEDILESSTPVIQIWEGVVITPIIGMLDSERTQQIMEHLLQRIVDTHSKVALLDITGVPAIDTGIAQHLVDTINAVRLLGSKVVLTGINPAIAQTLIHLGIDLSGVRTCKSLAEGLELALEVLELKIINKNSKK